MPQKKNPTALAVIRHLRRLCGGAACSLPGLLAWFSDPRPASVPDLLLTRLPYDVDRSLRASIPAAAPCWPGCWHPSSTSMGPCPLRRRPRSGAFPTWPTGSSGRPRLNRLNGSQLLSAHPACGGRRLPACDRRLRQPNRLAVLCAGQPSTPFLLVGLYYPLCCLPLVGTVTCGCFSPSPPPFPLSADLLVSVTVPPGGCCVVRSSILILSSLLLLLVALFAALIFCWLVVPTPAEK